MICQFDGCDRPRRSALWCNTHQRQYERRGADGMLPIGQRARAPLSSAPCLVDGCGKPSRALGRCPRHYADARARRLAQDVLDFSEPA